METPELSETEKLAKREEEKDLKDLGEMLKKKVTENNGVFSETIPIKPDGSLEIMDSGNNLKSLFAHMGHKSSENLYALAHKVQQKTPDLIFSFERDNEGRTLTYRVQTQQN